MIDANVIASAIKQHEEKYHEKAVSSSVLINAEMFHSEMKRKIGCGTQREFAIAHDVSEAFVSDVLLGRREISYKMANAMGYRLVPMFQKVKE